MPKITINGQVYEAAKGKTIIQAADDVGMEIPRYCYHPDIGIEGSCRMCLVEVKGTPKLLPACATPLADNMEVRTDTQRVHEAVRYAMEFLLLHHPIDCPVCDQSGECWLQDYYMAHAGHDSRYPLGQKTRRRKACNLRIDHSARAAGGGIPGYTASDGKIYRTVGRRNVEVNKSWLCDEGRLSFHTLERWPRLWHARAQGGQKPVSSLLPAMHANFE